MGLICVKWQEWVCVYAPCCMLWSCKMSILNAFIFLHPRCSTHWKLLYFFQIKITSIEHVKCEAILTSNLIFFSWCRLSIFIVAINGAYVCFFAATQCTRQTNFDNGKIHLNCITNKNNPFDRAFLFFFFIWKVKAFLFFLAYISLWGAFSWFCILHRIASSRTILVSIYLICEIS